MNEPVTIECGAGYERPLMSSLFGEMFKIASRTVMHYQGDMFYDAISLSENLAERGGAFVWAVRQYGTTMLLDLDVDATRFVMRNNRDAYLVVCYQSDKRLGIWSATFERLDENLSDDEIESLISRAKELCK